MRKHYLFAYGSLLTGTGDRVLDRLMARACAPVGEAIMQGKLFDLGSYPGALPSSCPSDEIRGQLFLLKQPQRVLRMLDAYEGISLDTGYGEYVRHRVPVTLTATGHQVDAWVYFYAGRVTGRPRIASGDYQAYLAHTDSSAQRNALQMK